MAEQKDEAKKAPPAAAAPNGPTVPVVVQGQLLNPPAAGKGKKRGEAPVSLLDGPDIASGAPVEGKSTIMTSAGEMDRETAIMGRIGGVGTVSIQSTQM